MAGTADLMIVIDAKDQASKILKGVGDSAGGLGKTLGDVGKIAGGFLAANVVSSGVQALTGFIGSSIAAAKESIAVNAQLEAVLKSTGGAAGVTADGARELAAALEKTTKFEDEAIIQGENLLLTFTNIGKDVFPQATETLLDMAQALGTDAKGSAIQLGKALNDPIAGISALSRVGVSFTEEQKAQIQAMQEAGDVAGAQKLILAELNKEFGGSARAASDAAGAEEVYKDKMNDLQEQIGTKMLPIQLKITEAKAAMVALIAEKVIPILEELYAKHWPAISAAIEKVVSFIQENWPLISDVIGVVFDFVKTKIEGFIQQVSAIVEIVTSTVALVKAIFAGDWATAWQEMKDIAGAIIDLLVGTIKAQFGNIPQIILGLAGDFFTAAASLGNNLLDGIVNGIGDLAGAFIQVVKDAWNAMVDWADRNLKLTIGGTSTPFGDLPSVTIDPDLSGFKLATGHPYIPFDDYPALLHRGERVMTAAENRDFSQGDRRAAGAGESIIVNLSNSVIYARDKEDARRATGDIGWAIGLRRRGLSV